VKPKLYQVLLIVAVVAASLLTWTVYAKETKSSKIVWEYNIATFSGDQVSQLSQLGAQGWELIAVRSEEEMLGNFRHVKVRYYLKRAKP
jgi:lipopolysaccharide export system protein LptC